MVIPESIDDLPQLPLIDGSEIRHCPGFIGYAISDAGKAFSCLHGKGLQSNWHELRPGHSKRKGSKDGGRMVVALSTRFGVKMKGIHHLVLEAFVGPRPSGMEGCHFPDRSVKNNALSNLRWDTPKANSEDARIHGTRIRGSTQGQSKLTNKDVLAIVEMRNRHPFHYCGVTGFLATWFGVDNSTIADIWRGTKWSWLTGISRKSGLQLSVDQARIIEWLIFVGKPVSIPELARLNGVQLTRKSRLWLYGRMESLVRRGDVFKNIDCKYCLVNQRDGNGQLESSLQSSSSPEVS
jgi:hypothetical protein